MSSLIDLKHPYEIKNLNSINEYLFVLKNILRIASQKKVKEKPEGLNIPVRWSNTKNDFVVDFGSNKQRDMLGIHLNNLSLHYDETTETFNSIVHILNKIKNSINAHGLFEKYNLKKNENRFFNFIVNNNDIYLSGLYNRCQNSKRSGIYSVKNKKSILIDNSEEFLISIQKDLDFIKYPKSLSLTKKYNEIYLEFLEKIELESLTLKNNDNFEQFFNLKDLVYKEHDKKRITVKQYYKIIKKKDFIKDDILFWFLIYHITLMFNNIVLKSLNSSNISNIIIYDSISDEFIKIVNKFNINLFNKEKVLKAPLLPMSF